MTNLFLPSFLLKRVPFVIDGTLSGRRERHSPSIDRSIDRRDPQSTETKEAIHLSLSTRTSPPSIASAHTTLPVFRPGKERKKEKKERKWHRPGLPPARDQLFHN
mmetsp:Transcript_37642/g.120750  ORF Transcript_37642/g.120750 Transcript_37642/m.120750 type:complete len:105 (-) Transcript_37642:43-357(-)